MPDFVSPLRLASLVSSAMPWGLLAAAAGALVVAAFVDARRQRHLPHIQYPTAGGEVALNYHKRTIARCPTLLEPYQPVPFLTNPHVETIFAAKFRKSPTNVHYTRQCLLMPDGGCVALDWEHKPEPDKELPANAPVLILLPGLTGGSEDSYVMWAVARAASRGMRAVVFNSRGTADSPVTTPQYYSASFTGDMRRVVDHVHKKYPAAPLLAAGWSLGANIMIRYLGEEGHATPIKAAVSMCNPFNLTISNEHLTRGFNKIYDKNLASGLKKIHNKHRRVWQGKLPPQYDAEALELAANCSTIREFDEGITRRTFGWSSVATYYAQSSSSLSIPQVTVPLLCIQALDDPIAPKEAIPFEALAANPHTVLVTTGTGGHLGWCGGDEGATGHPWTDRPMIEWLESVLQELPFGRDGDMTTRQEDGEGEAPKGSVGAPVGEWATASKARQGVSVHATSGRGSEV